MDADRDADATATQSDIEVLTTADQQRTVEVRFFLLFFVKAVRSDHCVLALYFPRTGKRPSCPSSKPKGEHV